MNQERFKLIASVYLLFRMDDKILLLKRCNTGFEDGNYGLVSGHTDGDEKLTEAAVREAKEESGVDIDPGDLVLKTVMHRRQKDERIDFFFEPVKWTGEISNTEPEKCAELDWFSTQALPENTTPYVRQAIECYLEGRFYSEYWENS